MNKSQIPSDTAKDKLKQLLLSKNKNIKTNIRSKETSLTPDKLKTSYNSTVSKKTDITTSKMSNNIKTISSNNQTQTERKKELLLKYFPDKKITSNAPNLKDKIKASPSTRLKLTPDVNKRKINIDKDISKSPIFKTLQERRKSITKSSHPESNKDTINSKSIEISPNKSKINRLSQANYKVLSSVDKISPKKIQKNNFKTTSKEKIVTIKSDIIKKSVSPLPKPNFGLISQKNNIEPKNNVKNLQNKKIRTSSAINFKEDSINKAILPKQAKKNRISKYSELTKTGFTGDSNKVNQDFIAISNNFPVEEDSKAFFVFDGHGEFGHIVSKYLGNVLLEDLKLALKLNKLRKSNKSISDIIEESFIMTNKKLMNEPSINSEMSGSTCIGTIICSDRIYCANVGDSRALVGRLVDKKWTYQLLSRDHKPCETDEEERIIQKNGRIEKYKDENDQELGPLRVWRKNDNIPGIAMSRSFGDKVAKKIGVIADPEVFEWEITGEDKFVIVGSDGLWELMSNQEVVDYVRDYYANGDCSGAVNFLISEASKRWIAEDDIIDDISVILIFLDD